MRLATFLTILLPAILLAIGVAGIVNAAPACGPLEQVLRDLDARFHERGLWEGLDRNGGRTILTVAPDGSTWTALRVQGATACIVAAGEKWQVGPAAPAPGTEG